MGVIIHIYVDALNIINPNAPNGISENIQHLPFSKESINESVTVLKGITESLPDFSEGFNEWKTAFESGEAGIWTLTVKETIVAVETVFSQSENNNL